VEGCSVLMSDMTMSCCWDPGDDGDVARGELIVTFIVGIVESSGLPVFDSEGIGCVSEGDVKIGSVLVVGAVSSRGLTGTTSAPAVGGCVASFDVWPFTAEYLGTRPGGEPRGGEEDECEEIGDLDTDLERERDLDESDLEVDLEVDLDHDLKYGE